MDAALVDTDVVSFTFKRDTRHHLYRPHLDGKLLSLSFMTVAELDLPLVTHNRSHFIHVSGLSIISESPT